MAIKTTELIRTSQSWDCVKRVAKSLLIITSNRLKPRGTLLMHSPPTPVYRNKPIASPLKD